MNSDPQVDEASNPSQITMSKGRLRVQLRELELEIVRLKGAPLRREAEKLRVQNERLAARCAAIEEQALAVVNVALKLARLVAVEPDDEVSVEEFVRRGNEAPTHVVEVHKPRLLGLRGYCPQCNAKPNEPCKK